jgi:hypothetical protein
MGPVPPSETRSGVRQGAGAITTTTASRVGRRLGWSLRLSERSDFPHIFALRDRGNSPGRHSPERFPLANWDVEVRWVAEEIPGLNAAMHFDTIPPEDKVAWEVPDFLSDGVDHSLMVAITFRDAAMVWWSRDEHGIWNSWIVLVFLRGIAGDILLVRFVRIVGNYRWPGHLPLPQSAKVGRGPTPLWSGMTLASAPPISASAGPQMVPSCGSSRLPCALTPV